MNATRKFVRLTLALAASATAPAFAQDTKDAAQPRKLPQPTVPAPLVGQRYAPTPPAANDPKAVTLRLLADARMAMAAGDTARAEQLVVRASKIGVPETAFAPNEDTPSRLAMELRGGKYRQDHAVMTTGAELPADGGSIAQQALHVPESDETANRMAAALVGPNLSQREPRVAQLPLPTESIRAEPTGSPLRSLAQGEQHLREGNLDAALESFQAANAGRRSLDAGARRRLDDHLRMLDADAAVEPATLSGSRIDASMIEEADDAQQVLARQLAAKVGQTQVEARELRGSEPRRALEMLQDTRGEVSNSGLTAQYREQLQRRIDRTIADTKKYIEDNRAQIELDETNAAILADIDRENAAEQRKREKMQELIEQFNDLRDEYRMEEAEAIAKRLIELAPDDPVAKQVYANAKFIRRNYINDQLQDMRDTENWAAFNDVEVASLPIVGDGREMRFGADWEDLRKRKGFSDYSNELNARELQIQQRLLTPVQLDFTDRPLAEVMGSLSRMAGHRHLPRPAWVEPRGRLLGHAGVDQPQQRDLA
ncbi:MAG: hypothetical protein AAF266_05190 [Planctomycetota bacterium]